jgi:hypothetical protein
MSDPNPYQHIPSYSSRISKAALDAAQYAQQQVNSLQSLLGDTAYSIAMSTDVTHLLKDAAYYASDEAVKQIDSSTKALSSISADVMKEVIRSTQGIINARIPQSAIDSIALINTAIESIKGIQFDTIAAKHITVNYEQYKPVADALEGLQHDNNIPLDFNSIPVQDSSDTVTDNISEVIKEQKPVNVIAIISLILSIYGSYLGTYTNFLKPSIAGEQLQLEKEQLAQSKLDYNEEVRHNKITEEQGRQTLIFTGKMYDLLINLTNTEAEVTEE